MSTAKTATRILMVASVAVLLQLIAGCSLVDQSKVQKDDKQRIPWNSQAEWEGSVIGVPQ